MQLSLTMSTQDTKHIPRLIRLSGFDLQVKENPSLFLLPFYSHNHDWVCSFSSSLIKGKNALHLKAKVMMNKTHVFKL